MANNRQDIIKRVNKLFALAVDTSSLNEATEAVLKAQQLIAQYNIEEHEFAEEVKRVEIKTMEAEVVIRKKWAAGLAAVVARSFRCKAYQSVRLVVVTVNGKEEYRKQLGMNFYGYEPDACAAKAAFDFLYWAGDNFATNQVRVALEQGESILGVYNSAVIGFLNGVESELDKQCQALMITTPKEVQDSYDDLSRNWCKSESRIEIGISAQALISMKLGYKKGKLATRSQKEVSEHIKENPKKLMTAKSFR